MSLLYNKKNLNLLKELIISSFKLRNEGSILGILWYLLTPLLTLGVLYIVFSKNIGSSIPNFAFYVLIGVIQWNFLSSSTIDGMLSLDKYNNLIKKTNFPRELLILSAVFNLFLSHLIEWVLLIVLLIFTIGLSKLILLVPIILTLQIMLSLFLSLILASFYSYYKDVQNIWKVTLFIGWFLTPIFYLKDMIPQKFSFINLINPMTYIITFTRDILLYKKVPDLIILAIIFLIFFTALVIGSFIFKKLIINVAERI